KSSESSARAKLEKFLFKKETNIQSLKDGQDSPIHNLTSNYELKNASSENDTSLLLDNVKLNLQERLEFMNTIWTPDFKGGIGKQSLGMLCTKEFSNWKHAIEKFKNHEETAMADELIENRKLVMPVIECIIFCGRQGLSLRSHNDSGPFVMEHEPIENDGNFRAVLRYGLRMNSMGNSDLQLKRERCKHETADVAGIEQFSICARYIYNNEIKEDFLNFVPVESTTGESLAHTLIKSLDNFGVNIQYLREQGYDGAASMSEFNGVQSIIKKQYKTAVYVHCSAHVLNLVICSSCEIACIRNAMGIIETVYNFLNTLKRQCVLQSEVKTYIDLQESIVSSLEIMAGWVDKETSSKATLLLLSLSDTTFNVNLMVIDEVFKHSYILCKALQRDNIDLIEAMNLAEDLTNEVKQMRQNKEKSKLLNFDIHIPRTCKCQTNRYNISTDSASLLKKHRSIIKGFQSLFDNDLDKNRNDILELIQFYKDSDDLSDPDIVITELKMWKNLLKIVCILPVTTCTSERSFSSLRRLKTYLRSTMAENRLNGLAMLSIHREKLLTPEEVIEQLIKKNRRLKF
ncbi:52 kDa repressor of the inhibitor of the protein kinase-like, partial [Aphis craccivora]